MNRRRAMGQLGAAMIALGAVSRSGRVGAGAAPSLITRRIPGSSEALPVIGLGTWQTFDVSTAADKAELEQVLLQFADQGGRVIDSSPMYGKSEEVVGELSAKRALRSRQFLATKVWTEGRAAGVRQMEDSMRKLRTETIDLMQVHNLVDVETHLATLRDWKRAGRIRYLGLTHYTASAHETVARQISKNRPDFIQINYSIGEREAEKRLLSLARDRGVAVIANRPFAGGALFSRLRSRPFPPWAAEIGCTSWAQLMLKFVVSHPAITCAIPGTGRVDHLLDNLQAGVGPLPDEKLRARIAAEAA